MPTGHFVPPNPGTVGALGIALLAGRELKVEGTEEGIDLSHLLEAQLLKKDSFRCESKRGCGGAGNRCRIDRLTTRVAGREQKFLWGGNCSMYDRGTGKRKLPDLAPDPFRERQAFIQSVIEDRTGSSGGRGTVALTDEFVLKNLFPFFATFVRELGFDLIVRTEGDQKLLKRGIEESNVPYCAPLQLFSGVVSELLEAQPDILLLPMLRDLPRVQDEAVSTTCPLSQASPDLLRLNLGDLGKTRIVAPVIDMGPGNMESRIFLESCRRMARQLGIRGSGWRKAFQRARGVQDAFQAHCNRIGRETLDFCLEKDVVPVVVLGRAYTIYNDVLNANVPALLREQGAIAIPVDCYPLDKGVPIYREVFWGYSQTNLRVSQQIRDTRGVYSMFCSNYSCGPDSFNLHFFAYLMDGKPFAVIETDGHSGDAGTKTRIEAFLYCVEMDRRAGHASDARPRKDLLALEKDTYTLEDVKKSGDRLLIPAMGQNAEVAAAGLRAEGIRAEALPMPDHDAVRLGRRYTSGKECVPMTVTLGSVLQKVQAEDPGEHFTFFMPATKGPCRFGMYNLLDKVIFEMLGLQDRVRVVSQPESDFFNGVSTGTALRIWASFVAADLLEAMLHHARPVERRPGAAGKIYEQYYREVSALQEASPAPSLAAGLATVLGNMFGLKPLLAKAAAEFAAEEDPARRVPTVAVVGEIYVRCDPFSNDFVINRLEKRGIRVKFAPFSEFIEYTDWANTAKLSEGRHEAPPSWVSERITVFVKRLVVERLYDTVRPILGWPERLRVSQSLEAAEPYLSSDLHGEAVLTLGGPIHEYEQEEIIGVVNVGPLECMPTKIAEAQFFHVAEQKGLIPLNLQLNGEPMDPELLDNFAYEVHNRFARDEETLRQAEASARTGIMDEERAGREKGVNGRTERTGRFLPAWFGGNGRGNGRTASRGNGGSGNDKDSPADPPAPDKPRDPGTLHGPS